MCTNMSLHVNFHHPCYTFPTGRPFRLPLYKFEANWSRCSRVMIGKKVYIYRCSTSHFYSSVPDSGQTQIGMKIQMILNFVPFKVHILKTIFYILIFKIKNDIGSLLFRIEGHQDEVLFVQVFARLNVIFFCTRYV